MTKMNFNKKLRIGLDIDDTLAGFSQGYLERFGKWPKVDWAITRNVNNILIKEKEMKSKKIKENERISGGYCDLNCQYCYEELFDSGGGVVGDLDSEGYTEYYCHLGHSITFGRFCEDYK